ncbi:charged multivesicular body protein 6-like isoform X1 [Thalassophryne amazonica]|uniref:charged multivesicular body protein 6-like isoform X1 n=2 Tax=Thalassophryne amazonica TaxID=390379 RepID=UPI0014710C6B|nr:charged multivesicular body protein 6-like isoform X1 [Thalassophryne amazonica]
MWLNNGKHFWPKESTFSGNRTRQSYFGKQLKQQRDKLKQYQKRVMLQLEKERLLAKQLLKDGRKEKALLLLKKKIYQYRLLDKTESQISNLECMVQDIEFMQIEMKVIEGLKVGNNCLKSMHEIMSIEDVERIMDETQESIDYQRQIDEMLAGALTEEDEDAVLAELEAITQGEAVTLPEVPTEPLPEVSEAAQAEPERKEARNKPDGEMLAV